MTESTMIQLDAIEARVLGCLIEKQYLTPDQYPLSFNALLNGCNQLTSREPVMALDVDIMGKGLGRLRDKGLAEQKLGSRVPKFTHCAAALGAGDTIEVLGVVCMLLLRGPQTASELRVRTERISKFATNENVEATLEKLINDPAGPFVARLARGRFMHLFSGAPIEGMAPSITIPVAAPSPDRLAKLEERVAKLEELCKKLEERVPPAKSWPS